jgi:hypothetical protein
MPLPPLALHLKHKSGRLSIRQKSGSLLTMGRTCNIIWNVAVFSNYIERWYQSVNTYEKGVS